MLAKKDIQLMLQSALRFYNSKTKRRELNRDKIALIDFAFVDLKAKSFVDLGGIWRVEAGYTFYALDVFKPDRAVLIDTYPTPLVLNRLKNYPQLQFLHGNFSDADIAVQVEQVDTILLFDVLLHQVQPDWDQVLDLYAPRARSLLIFNQQWIGSDTTIRLLDLGEENYFANVPHTKHEHPYIDLFQKLDQKHPEQRDRLWRNVHDIWQWGITDDTLKDKVTSLGYKLQFFKNCGQFGNLKNFENHAFVFSR